SIVCALTGTVYPATIRTDKNAKKLKRLFMVIIPQSNRRGCNHNPTDLDMKYDFLYMYSKNVFTS
ncbi:MAG TPA: hypothetical protein QGG06_00720, partial [Gammaproteobacteria bacterium]|nr:hypothetical protein [Gammaproteobacteria bacterium]